MSILLRNVRWFDGKQEKEVASLLLSSEGPRVVESAPDGVETVDAKGCWLLPALAELHADFRQPGLEHVYTFELGVQAMVRGGFSCALLTPQTDPVIDHPSAVELVRRQVERHPVDLRIAAALSIDLEGKKLPELVEMQLAGASAFSTGLSALPSTRFLCLELSYASQTHCRSHLFPMEQDWSQGVSVPEGGVADLFGLPGRPEYAETIAVFRILEAARSLRSSVHLKHLTLPASIAMVAKARAEGLDVTCDVPLLHLAFDEEDLDGLNTSLHLLPPLRSSAVRRELLRMITEGEVDAIASQHIPVLPENKNDHFSASHPGAVGLESAFSLLIELLGGFTPATVRSAVRLLSDGPRRILGLDQAAAADEWMLWDPTVERILAPADFAGAVANTPLLGRTLRGRCRGVSVRGQWLQVSLD